MASATVSSIGDLPSEAAVLVIAAGSIFLLQHSGRHEPYIQEPVTAVTTTVMKTTSVSETTDASLQTSADMTVTSAVITTTHTSQNDNEAPDDDQVSENRLSPFKNPCPQLKSISDEEIDEASELRPVEHCD